MIRPIPNAWLPPGVSGGLALLGMFKVPAAPDPSALRAPVRRCFPPYKLRRELRELGRKCVRESNGHRLATVGGSDGEKICVRRRRYRSLIKNGSRCHPRQLSRDLTGKLGRAGEGGERIEESLRIARWRWFRIASLETYSSTTSNQLLIGPQRRLGTLWTLVAQALSQDR